nr:reverse transcriptase domain-containing protein [Tanacetum cinerariifolium]
MTLELADRSISCRVGVAEDVFVKLGTFHFLADFVVVDFNADPRVPLYLGRSFLKTERSLIDVSEGEPTLRVGKEAITFNLDQTSRYSTNYNDMTANRIDVIDMACEEYSQEVLCFSDMIVSGNPTLYYDPIVSTSSPTLTPFGDSNFLLEEVDAFLALENDPTSSKVDQSYVDTELDILLLEAFLNDDPSLPPLNQGNYLSQLRKELKIYEAKTDKSSIDEPPEVEIKDLPPHLEYAFLEGDDKLPVGKVGKKVNSSGYCSPGEKVILNGDSPIPTRVVDGVVQAIAPTTDEQRLAKKNELKVIGTLLIALPDKHQLNFNIHKYAKSIMEAIENSLPLEWRTHTLIWRNKANLEDHGLDDLFNNLKIYEAKVNSSSSTSHTKQNIAFVSSQNTDTTTESVSAVPSVSAASTKVLVFALPNVDNLSDAVIYSFFSNGHADYESQKISSMDWKESRSQWNHFYRVSYVEGEMIQLPSKRSFCKGVQCDGVGSYDWSFQANEEPTNYALMSFTSSSLSSFDNENENVFEKDIKLLKHDVMLRDNALVELRKKFETAEKGRDKLKHTLEKFQTSSKSLCKLLESQITDKTSLGYDNQMFTSTLFDCDELNSSVSDVSMLTSPVHDSYKSGEGYHVVPC